MVKRKIAIVGTNGIPAQYGGFETLAHNLTDNLKEEFDFVVYCSKSQKAKIYDFNGVRLVNLDLKANGISSYLYDILSLVHASFFVDLILYLGPGAGFLLTLLKIFGVKVVVNHGGLNEWKRSKYNVLQRFMAKLGHKYGAKYAVENIADNLQLQKSLFEEFNVNSTVIRYGGDHTAQVLPKEDMSSIYPFLNEEYYLNVSRAQVDNNLHVVLKAFESIPNRKLVIISNWGVSEYGKQLKAMYEDKFKNIILLDAIYDSVKLNTIRQNAKVYIHSHSYCGTAPSLVEAMCLGLPIIGFDVKTNRETTHNKAIYFSSAIDLKNEVLNLRDDDISLLGNNMKDISIHEYKWSKISMEYSSIFRKHLTRDI